MRLGDRRRFAAVTDAATKGEEVSINKARKFKVLLQLVGVA
jgi:hypothetical protein